MQVVFPSEGVGYEVAAMSILKGAKNVDDAKKLVDWMTSADGQGALSATKTYFLPIRSDVSGGTGRAGARQDQAGIERSQVRRREQEAAVERWTKDVLGQ